MAAARHRKTDTPKQAQNSKLVAAVLMVCCLAVAACITFGSPALWSPVSSSPGFTHLDPAGRQSPPDSAAENNGDVSEKEMETIAEYRTISQLEDSARAENLVLAANSINRIEIGPGETFSFNEVVGDAATDSRYLDAPTVIHDEIGTAQGGGVAQVATALYVAGLKSGLEVVERHPHEIPVDFASIGLDAAIAFGEKDLKLKNNSQYPVHISAEAVGQTVTVRFIGQPLGEGNTIGAASMVVDRFNENNERLAADAVVDPSQTLYYVVDSYRIYYKDAMKEGQDYLSSDTYKVAQNAALILESGGFAPIS